MILPYLKWGFTDKCKDLQYTKNGEMFFSFFNIEGTEGLSAGLIGFRI